MRIVQAAVTPTSVFPAPHGSTMTPDLARPLPNICLKLFSYTLAFIFVSYRNEFVITIFLYLIWTQNSRRLEINPKNKQKLMVRKCYDS